MLASRLTMRCTATAGSLLRSMSHSFFSFGCAPPLPPPAVGELGLLARRVTRFFIFRAFGPSAEFAVAPGSRRPLRAASQPAHPGDFDLILFDYLRGGFHALPPLSFIMRFFANLAETRSPVYSASPIWLPLGSRTRATDMRMRLSYQLSTVLPFLHFVFISLQN